MLTSKIVTFVKYGCFHSTKFSNVARVQNFIAIPNLSLVSSLGQTFGLTDDPVEP